MAALTEWQLDLSKDWPIPAVNRIQRQPSKSGGLSLIPLMIWDGTACASGVSSPFLASSCPVWHQQAFRFNLICVDRGLSLAPNGKWPRLDYCVGEVSELVNHLVRDFEDWHGRQRKHTDKYRSGMDTMLANLLNAHQCSGQLLIRRDNTHRIYHYRNPARVSDGTLKTLSEFLWDRGYIDLQLGKANEYQGNASWCIPLFPLIALYEQHKARIRLHEKAELAELRTRPTKVKSKNGRTRKEKGTPIELPPSSRERDRLKRLAEPVRAYTATWLNHTATLDRRYILPWVRRVFIESTNLGGRLYGPFQNIPSADRGRILIDGKRTIELDFKAIHFNILYAEEGLSFVGYAYDVPGYPKEAAKAVCLQLANAENLAALKGCITRSAGPELQRQYYYYQRKKRDYALARSTGLKATAPQEPPALEGFIEGIPAGTRGEEMLDAILTKHSAIAHRFGGKDIGLRLQRKDSDIMVAALKRLEGIPVLPVHDSIRCKASDEGIVMKAMHQACIEVIGQRIPIERK